MRLRYDWTGYIPVMHLSHILYSDGVQRESPPRDNFGYSTAFHTVKKVGHKNCGTLQDSTKNIGPSHFF